jgi:hypothetical protein
MGDDSAFCSLTVLNMTREVVQILKKMHISCSDKELEDALKAN